MSAASTVEGKSLSERCERLRQEWAAAERQRMSEDYRSLAGVDEVTGALGPLYFAKVTIEGTPVDGMIDPGSSATIISFDLFKKVGGKARIPSRALEVPHVTLTHYTRQRPNAPVKFLVPYTR